MDSEMEQFLKDFLESVKQMKRGEAARTTLVKLPEVTEARVKMGIVATSVCDSAWRFSTNIAGLGTRAEIADRCSQDIIARGRFLSRSFARNSRLTLYYRRVFRFIKQILF